MARMEEGKGVHKVLVGKPGGKRPLERPRRRWEDNIKMDLEEVGSGCGDWLELAQDRDRWRALVERLQKEPKIFCVKRKSSIVKSMSNGKERK